MEELKKLRALIEIERKEDLRQYQNKIILTPLKERVSKGLTWYPVQISYREIGAGENFYLSLDKVNHLKDNPAFQVGDSVSLFNQASNAPKQANMSGVVASVWRDKIRIAFNVDELPDWLDYGSLGIDLLFDSITYREMNEALNKVMEAKNDRLAELRAILGGKEKARFLSDQEVPDYHNFPELNPSQNQAVRNILVARDVAIIHGPPGTGKTTTMVQAVKVTLEKEKQVLVTAPSNTAVDLLTLRLAEKGLTVLRIGNPARMSEELSPISLEAQIAQHPDFRYLKKLRKQSEEMRQMASKYKRHFGSREREQRRLLFAEASRLKSESTILENYIINSLLEHAQVITATLVGSVNKYIRNRQFSTVFIDEAAQALEPACWIPISKSHRVVMAG
ncbi:MAG: AAA domain-containing protein, partial [Bacteroidota bacterium]